MSERWCLTGCWRLILFVLAFDWAFEWGFGFGFASRFGWVFDWMCEGLSQGFASICDSNLCGCLRCLSGGLSGRLTGCSSECLILGL